MVLALAYPFFACAERYAVHLYAVVRRNKYILAAVYRAQLYELARFRVYLYRRMEIASNMLGRHKALTKFLISLGIDDITAEKDACKIEHDISQQTFEAICAHAVEHEGKPVE